MAAASAQICALLMFIQVSLALQYWDQGCPAIVAAGSHEKTSPAPNFQFRTDAIIGTKVVFDSSKTARYLFAADNTKGFYCSSSWNKGFGASRCGSTNFHHQDSDRFVWRRSPECIVQGANGTMSEMVPGTPGFANSSCGQNNYLDYVEIAAYAYDDGRKPFENTPELLKVFKTRMRVGSRYAWKISDGGRNVTYDLFDANMTLLESQIITHRSCDSSGYFTGTVTLLLWTHFFPPAPGCVANRTDRSYFRPGSRILCRMVFWRAVSGTAGCLCVLFCVLGCDNVVPNSRYVDHITTEHVCFIIHYFVTAIQFNKHDSSLDQNSLTSTDHVCFSGADPCVLALAWHNGPRVVGY